MAIFMTLSSEFTGIRAIEGNMVPVTWKVKADLDTSEATNEALGLVTYHKLVFWISEVLDSVAVIHSEDPYLEFFYNSVNNPLMVLPNKPTDDQLCAILSDKIASIAGHANIKLLGLSLTGNDTQVTYNCIYTEPQVEQGISYVYQDSCKEYARKGLKLPWWKRPDGDINDFLNEDELQDGVTQLDASRYDVLEDFGKQVAQTLGIAADVEEKKLEKTAKIVEFKGTEK